MRMQESRARVATVDPVTDPIWRDLVTGHDSCVFHSPQWLEVLARTYGFEPRAAVLIDGASRATAGIPYCVVDAAPQKRIAAPPFSDYADPLVSEIAEWNALIEPLFAEQCRISLRCLRNTVATGDERFTVVDRAKWHGLDLTPDVDALWEGLHSSARRAVRKAEKEGLVVREATDKTELRAFFELHLRTRKHKYRLLAQPYAFFEHIWELFVEQGTGAILGAYAGDHLAGSVFFLEWQGTWYYKFSASEPASMAARPNDLIIWTAIRLAKQRGLTELDFGLSDWDQEGLLRYKRKYADVEREISFLRFEPDSRSGAAMQMQLPMGSLTELFTDAAVPDAITERAGELLYRFFA